MILHRSDVLLTREEELPIPEPVRRLIEDFNSALLGETTDENLLETTYGIDASVRNETRDRISDYGSTVQSSVSSELAASYIIWNGGSWDLSATLFDTEGQPTDLVASYNIVEHEEQYEIRFYDVYVP